jgi:O-antigen/teichoic acid export membrane protein
MSRIFRNTLYYSLGEIIPRILSFILLPVLTTYLTTFEYGINSYTTTVMTFLYVVGSLSLNTFVLKTYHITTDEILRKQLIWSVFIFICVFNIVLSILQLLIFPGLLVFFNVNIPFKPFFIISIINNFFDVIAIIPLVLYRVKEDAKSFLILSLSRTILQFIAVYIFVVILEKGLEGSYYARLLVNIPFLLIYFQIISKNSVMKIDFVLLKSAIRFSLPLLPGSLAYLFVSLSDRLLLERYIGLEELGIYSVAATLVLVLNIVIQAFYKTFEPILFKEFLSSDFQETNLKFYKVYLSILFIAAFSTAIFSKEFFQVFTSPAFNLAYKIVPLLTLSVVIFGINTYLNVLMIANNKQKIVSMVSIISAFISILFNLLFIPIYGLFGAVIASTMSFLFTNVVYHQHVKIISRYILSQILLLFGLVVISYYFNLIFAFDSMVENFFVKILILIVFALATLFFFQIRPRDIIKYFGGSYI